MTWRARSVALARSFRRPGPLDLMLRLTQSIALARSIRCPGLLDLMQQPAQSYVPKGAKDLASLGIGLSRPGHQMELARALDWLGQSARVQPWPAEVRSLASSVRCPGPLGLMPRPSRFVVLACSVQCPIPLCSMPQTAWFDVLVHLV